MMIFDDHDVHDDWNTSIAWVEEMRSHRLVADADRAALCLLLGLPAPRATSRPAELAEQRAARSGSGALPDAGPLLLPLGGPADRGSDGSRWSYARDFGGMRMVVFDSREGRVLGRVPAQDDRRRRVGVARRAGDRRRRPSAAGRHAAVPAVPGVHHLEAWNEAVCAGAWGRLGDAAGREAAAGARPRALGRVQRLVPPARASCSIEVAPAGAARAGDDRRCSAATCTTPTWREVAFREGTGAQSAVYQAVCSPFRNALDRHERVVVRPATRSPAMRLARALARAPACPIRRSAGAWPRRRPSTTSSRRSSWRAARADADRAHGARRPRRPADRDVARAAPRVRADEEGKGPACGGAFPLGEDQRGDGPRS